MCNCAQKPCNQCNSGMPCNCPPDFSINPLPSQCTCCPNGYTWVGPSTTDTSGSGQFINSQGILTQAQVTVTGGPYNVCASTAALNVGTIYYKTQVPGTAPEQDAFPTSLKVPCPQCADSVPTDCVIYQCIDPNTNNTSASNSNSGICQPCLNVTVGDNMSTIISKICPTNPATILQMLQVIAADTQYGLKQALCEIVNFCSGIPGSLTPFLGPASFTIP